jgi:hypothetical protein
MDAHAALDEVARWCALQTAAAPPWHLRRERGSSAGASSPMAQLRYDLEAKAWSLHRGGPPDGWCSYDDALQSSELGPLLGVIENDRAGRFQGLGAGYKWPWDAWTHNV